MERKDNRSSEASEAEEEDEDEGGRQGIPLSISECRYLKEQFLECYALRHFVTLLLLNFEFH